MTLQDDPSVESFFNVAGTETLALFEYLYFEFLDEHEHEPPELMCGFLHCYYRDIYGVRPFERELQNTVVWLVVALIDRRREMRSIAFSPTSNTSLTKSSTVSSQAAWRGLLNLTYCINSTDVTAIPADQDASVCYDPTAEKYYYGNGCTIVSTGIKDPDSSGVHRKQTSARRGGNARHL